VVGATRLFSFAAPMTRAAPAAIRSGPSLAVASSQAATVACSCGPSSGIRSGSSGARRAISSDRATASLSVASSSWFTLTAPARLPNTDVTVSDGPVSAPVVDAVLRAKRRLADARSVSETCASSAFDQASVFFTISCAFFLSSMATPAAPC